ncbi:Amino-acid biosynthesis, Histidine biosynthesis [Hyphomicrobium sp. 1Nfss2.1]|uniref:HisA/HisF-related TIM barrel protein n=1 Tax=Hyphomicrobium sp. 1Nfss2.1 TaxID=3413936 RepID=UPI003C79755C
MDVIPVIDVRHGVAVAAARGDRAAYKPIATPLAEGSDPIAIARGFARLFAFPILYVADLDAIEGRGANAALPERLASTIPGIALWVDAGLRPHEAREMLAGSDAATPIIGTESIVGEQDIAALEALPRDRFVLSLDFKGDQFIGPPRIIETPELWPDRLIVMTLARVGSGEGPDLTRIADIIARANGRRVYAAGGVRNRADIEALHKAGAAGVLVATALHMGKIKAGDLDEIAGL